MRTRQRISFAQHRCSGYSDDVAEETETQAEERARQFKLCSTTRPFSQRPRANIGTSYDEKKSMIAKVMIIRGYYSEEFANSKFLDMSPQDLIDYAGMSNEHRREVRNMLANNYEWFQKNGPNGLLKAISLDVTEFRRSILKRDPFDYYGIEAERIKRAEEDLKGSMLKKVLDFIFWTIVAMAVVGLVLTSMGL